MVSVYYVISLFERNRNPGDPTGIKLYLQSSKEIYKETDKIDISVSNAKEIVDNFISLSNRYGWLRLVFMVETAADANKTFRVVEHIQLEEIQQQEHRYFGLIVIVNITDPLPSPLIVSHLTHLDDGDQTQST